MFVSLSLCDLLLYSAVDIVHRMLCGSMEGVTFLFTTNAFETHASVIAIIKIN